MNSPALALALAVFFATPVFARDQLAIEAVQVLELKDGSTVYVFKDGKMAKEDRWGRTEHLKAGEILELKDGRKVEAKGNEVARLHSLLDHDRS